MWCGQGLEQLNEEKVVVVVRKEDAEFVRATGISQAKELYKKKQEREVEITLSEDEWLNEESMGGVIVTAHDGRIRCLNTFQHRLELASDQVMHVFKPALTLFRLYLSFVFLCLAHLLPESSSINLGFWVS